MFPYAISRGKPIIFQATFHATVQAQSVYGAGHQAGSSLTHMLNLLTPNPLPEANPMMGGRALW